MCTISSGNKSQSKIWMCTYRWRELSVSNMQQIMAIWIKHEYELASPWLLHCGTERWHLTTADIYFTKYSAYIRVNKLYYSVKIMPNWTLALYPLIYLPNKVQLSTCSFERSRMVKVLHFAGNMQEARQNIFGQKLQVNVSGRTIHQSANDGLSLKN